MEVRKWLKTDDPAERCEFILSNDQQCGNKAEPGVTRCPLHGANKQVAAQEARSLRQYRLARFQAKFEDKAGHNKLKTLHEEVAIMKMILEEKINSCTDLTELLLSAGPLSDLVLKVQKLVESCDRLDHKAGNFLDRTRIQNIATGLMQVVASKINEYAAANDISEESVSLLMEAIATQFLETLKDEQAI